MWKMFLQLFSLVLIATTFGYELVCPAPSEWHLRARAKNCTGAYVCLQRLPENYYIEDCNGPDVSNKGTKLVFQPYFNNAKCRNNRYQPFKFSTDGTSRCVYQKSFCNEEGQFVYQNGSFRNDTTCGCNFSKGYYFVAKPSNACYCLPSEEDCSCYKPSCKRRDNITDYQCLQHDDVLIDTLCPEVKTEMSQDTNMFAQLSRVIINDTKHITDQDYDSGHVGKYRLHCRISTTVLVFFMIIIVLLVGHVGNFCNKVRKRDAEKVDSVPAIENDQYINEFEKWKHKEKTFVSTRACKEVLHKIISHSCVAVTGVGGCGKSSIVWHVAFTLHKKNGYVNIVDVKYAADLESNYPPPTKTVFVLDDVWGKFTANKHQIEQWNSIKKLVKRVMSDSSCKILLSCRLQVFKDTIFSELEEFKACECNIISKDLCLTTEEKKDIFKTYMKRDLSEDIILSEKNYLFPLLCELYSKEKKPMCIEKYFTTPYEIYQEELDNLRKYDKLKLCGLILCVIFNNKLEEKAFKTMSHIFGQAVVNISVHLGLDIEKCRDGRKIENAIKTLEGTFVKVQNGFYMITHDKVFDILAYYFGKIMINEVIEYADSEFLRERLLWRNEEESIKTEEYIINFDNTSLPLYIKRLLFHWEKQNLYDVFCNINMKNDAFRDKFIKALNERPEECKKKLANICIDFRNDFAAGSTPLIITSSEGHVDLLEWLLRHDAKVNFSRRDGVSALYMASQKGHLGVVKTLLEKKADVNATTDEGVTPLGAACYISGNIDIVNELLDHNADVNKYKYQRNDMTPLYMACQNDFEKIVELLLQKNANPNMCLTDGSSPLLLSCIKEHTNVVRLLLDSNADPNTEISGGYTPLFAAACMGFIDIVELLLKKGADRKICLANTEEIKNEIKQLPLTPNHGNSTLQDNKKRMWSWFDSIVLQFTSTLAEYIKSKKESYLTDVFVESTPLHAACFMGHSEIVKLLIRGLSSVDITKNDGTTPLFYACELGHHDIVKALIEKGADPGWICGADKISPRQIAKINRHNKLLPLLKKK